MAPTSKQLRPTQVQESEYVVEDDFDFGDPEILEVEIYPGKYLSLREPSAEDLISIDKVSNDPKLDDIESTLAVICILHQPEPGKRRLSMKDAKRLRSKQIKILSSAMKSLMGYAEEEGNLESESEPDEEETSA